MGINWVGIERGYTAFKENEERKEERSYRRKQQDRLDEEFKEGKFLRRSKTLLDYLGPRGSAITYDTGKLVEIKTLLGDLPGANDYLSKLKASPYALETVHKALIKRSGNVGIPTGQELMDNITLIAENYGDENWMKQYEEGRDILETITLNPDKLLEDPFYLETKRRIAGLDATVKPTVGVQIRGGFTGEIDADKQVKIFDPMIQEFASNMVNNSPEIIDAMEGYSVDELLNDLNDYNKNKTKLRQLFGPIVLNQLQSDTAFVPGLSTVLSGFATGIPAYIPQNKIEFLKQNLDDPNAIEAFDRDFGQGAAAYILGI
tara:strand:+ start:77 stop:1030 length:954 start_codon:yes stop_codon:yes gene_type:complete